MTARTDDDNYVRIFDTTLRDGEQSPGCTMTTVEKLEVAKMLSRLGVDVIEAGFPAASRDDFAAVRAIAETVGREPVEERLVPEPPIVCGLARATKTDIDTAWQAVRAATRPRIHTFLATSPIHREHKLRLSQAEVLLRVREMVAYAKHLCDDVEFSPEDAARTEPEFLYEVVAVAIAAGATTLNIPDTVGYTTPEEYGALLRGIRSHVPGVWRIVLSCHCHDDLGLATANALAGVRAGARQVEVTVNGIGERAGNTSLEEIAMALHARRAHFGLRTGIDTTQLTRASKLVSKVSGMVVQPNKAIVGANAFAHESGIHQDGLLKHRETYEIMRPETVGAARTELVLGKHSGRHAFGARLAELGYALDGPDLERAFERFKALADKKKRMTDADLVALASDERTVEAEEHFALEALQVGCGTVGLPTATVRLRVADGATIAAVSLGTGPVDAVFKAIDSVVGVGCTLLEYNVQSVTEGIDALGEVSVRIAPSSGDVDGDGRVTAQHEGPRARTFHGHGADTDIIVASAKAYLMAQNRMRSATRARERRGDSGLMQLAAQELEAARAGDRAVS